MTTEVLDVGCGNNKRGTIGIDITKTPIVDIVCDASDLPFADKTFDGCYAYALLEHVDNPPKVLTEIHRILKSEGWLKILVPTDSKLKSDYVVHFVTLRLKRLLAQYRAMRLGIHKWQYSQNSLAKMLRTASFKVEEIECPSLPFVDADNKRGIGNILLKLRITRRPHLIMKVEKKGD